MPQAFSCLCYNVVPSLLSIGLIDSDQTSKKISNTSNQWWSCTT